ncbi:hypothetical protein BH09MYX1_BH09MYX1_15480 [soil metagenome]
MRTTTFFFLTLSTLASLSVGCGGDEATIEIPDTGTDSTSNIDSSLANDSSTSNDGSSATDGSTQSDGSIGPGDGGTTPGQVSCGNTSCNTTNEECCVRFAADGGADGGFGLSRACIAKNGQCQGGAKAECDEKADCPNAQVCCLELSGGGGAGAKCQSDCGKQGVQLCKTTPECTNDGGACTTYTCPGNNVIQSCKKPLQQCN